jgi:colanic acid biosynthesis glycosyl transferase WcaI
MKITIFTQYYDPEPSPAAKRTTATARKFASSGFAVDIITGFPNLPGGETPKPYRGKILSLDRDGSIRVTRVWTYASKRRQGIYRPLNWISVVFGAITIALLRIRSGDAIYVSAPPLVLLLPALIASWVSRAPLFVDVRDSGTDTAAEPHDGRRRTLRERAVDAIATTAYRRARTVFCASEAARDSVTARCGHPREVQIVSNGFDLVEPAADSPIRRTADEFVAVYSGDMDELCGVDVVLDAASQVRDDLRIRFVLVGDGSEAPRLRERARSEGLANVEFVGPVAASVTAAALRDADIALVTLPRQVLDGLPGTMFEALGVGCPLMVSGGGEARRFVAQAGAGWCVTAEDSNELAAAVRVAASDREACRTRGKSGRDYVLAHYDRDRLASGVVRSVFAATSPSIGSASPFSMRKSPEPPIRRDPLPHASLM